MLDTARSFPRQLAVAARAYRRTPERFRRPEPLGRAAAVIVAAWFGVLFVSLGLLSVRASAPAFTVAGYFAAAMLGLSGLAAWLTRRTKVGGGLLAAMLVLGQVVTVGSMLVL